MIKEIWLNLPVKDVKRTRDFFEKIGFTPNDQYSNPEMTGFTVGEKRMAVMFVGEEKFKEFARTEISDSAKGAEIMVSFDAESRGEVNEMARKVFDAGGTIFAEPSEIEGWMYGFGFADLDGHRWNMLFMDFSKMQK